MSSIIKVSAKPTLYYMLESPPCLTVITVARIIGVELALKPIDISAGEQKRPNFVRINPFKTVPAFVDTDGFTLAESRAIATYLIQSLSPNSPLYPQDLKKRATVDKMLQFDLGTFYRAITDVIYPIFTSGQIDRKKMPRLEEVLQTFDGFLPQNGSKFVAGDELTVADISMYFEWTLLSLSDEIDTSVYLAAQGWSRNVVDALKPYNQDGMIDNALENLKAYAEIMVQGIQVF